MRRATLSPTRIYVATPLAAGAVVPLPEGAAHHLARVLRAAVGDELVVFDGSGAEYGASITHIDKHAVKVQVAAAAAVDRESPLACALAQAVASGERMDYTLQKAVELGVARVQPLFSERGVVRLAGERASRRAEHWREVAISACEQCGRNLIPQVADPLAYTDWLAALAPVAEGELRLLLSPYGTQRLADFRCPSNVLLLAGPEGGFSEPEDQLAQLHGFTPVRLGPRVLRTETAALAALAAINTLWGDF